MSSLHQYCELSTLAYSYEIDTTPNGEFRYDSRVTFWAFPYSILEQSLLSNLLGIPVFKLSNLWAFLCSIIYFITQSQYSEVQYMFIHSSLHVLFIHSLLLHFHHYAFIHSLLHVHTHSSYSSSLHDHHHEIITITFLITIVLKR